ncbi:hypothetical protein MY1884_001502 [Beauveria asiatica]
MVGGVISSFATLLGLAIFPAPTTDPWTKISERVEALIGKKLQEHHVKALQSRMEGFRLNANEYAKVCKSYNDAAPDKKKEHAELLRTHHVGFLTMMRVSIPEFQVDNYAALTLPLFAQAANLHLTLLADGIKHGLDWGYPQELGQIIQSLNYAEFWPYLAGESKMPDSSLLNRDREVFRGPYIRYTENAPWSATAPPPVTKRTDSITAVNLCVSENVRSLQVKYGDTWGPKIGECRKPEIEQRSFTLEPDEYIENVDIVYGHKLGQLRVITNTGTVHGPYGDPRHADVSLAVNRTGYGLASMYSTHYERNDPEGIEA